MAFWGNIKKAFSSVTEGFKESFKAISEGFKESKEHIKEAFKPQPYLHDRKEDKREIKEDLKQGDSDYIIKPDTEKIYQEWLITKSNSSNVFMEFSDFFQEGKSP